MLKEPLPFWQNVVFTDEGCASLAMEFFKEMERDFLKKKEFEFGQRSLMFWGAIRSDGRKLQDKKAKRFKFL